MENRRPTARTAESGTAGDARVAGPAPKPTVVDAPVVDTPVAGTPVVGTPTVDKPTVDRPAGDAPAADTPGRPERRPQGEPPARLLDPAAAERLQKRWHEVQAGFVDDPGEAVRRADELTSDAVDALGKAIAAQRRTLAEDGAAGDHSDTERLRQALRRYRDLLNRVIEA
jgi:hypothetical protein